MQIAATTPRTSAVSMQWIINQRMDLVWFIGSALTAYLLLFLNAGLGWDMVTIWFIWVVFIDSPHFFGTISRTYLDKQEFAQRKRLLLGSLLWFVAGPAMLLMSYGLFNLGIASYTLPWKFFLLFFGLWAYWHIVRQHYGFMRLYQKKNGESAKVDMRIDSFLLYTGLILPFVSFVVRHPSAREQLGLVADAPAFPASVLNVSMYAWEHWVIVGTTAVILIAALAFVGRQLQKYFAGEAINGPKTLFLLAVVPLHIYICYSPAVLAASLLAFGAFVTIFHDFQYHAIVWFHHRNRYHKPGVEKKKFGLAPRISQSLPGFLACGVMFAVIFRLLGCSFEIHPGCGPFIVTSNVPLFGGLNTDALLKAVFLGFPLHHYFVDQFIWKTSKDKDLKKDLNLK